MQRSPTDCGGSERDREAPKGAAMTRNKVEATQKKSYLLMTIEELFFT